MTSYFAFGSFFSPTIVTFLIFVIMNRAPCLVNLILLLYYYTRLLRGRSRRKLLSGGSASILMPFLYSQRSRLNVLAARRCLPTNPHCVKTKTSYLAKYDSAKCLSAGRFSQNFTVRCGLVTTRRQQIYTSLCTICNQSGFCPALILVGLQDNKCECCQY